MSPFQTRTLQVGHIATFAWVDKLGTKREETWLVALSNSNETAPFSRSYRWLEPFIGKSVGYQAKLIESGHDGIMYTLLRIARAPEGVLVDALPLRPRSIPAWEIQHPPGRWTGME